MKRGERPPPSPLWCIKEIASYCGVSVSTIHRWRKAKRLPDPAKAWGHKRWDRQETIEVLGRGLPVNGKARCLEELLGLWKKVSPTDREEFLRRIG